MNIAQGIYQISGHPYGFNSNMFAVESKKGLIIIDAGFQEKQYESSNKVLRDWGLNPDNIAAVFITHAHFDHIGNAHIYEENGFKVCISSKDADVALHGGIVVLEPLFGKKYIPCKRVEILTDKEICDFGDVQVQVIETPGHTKGNAAFLVKTKAGKVLFVGDMLVNGGTTPTDELLPKLGWIGSPDFNEADNIKSFEKLRNLDVDIVAPGHGSVYYGNSAEMFEKLYEMSKSVKKRILH